MSSRNRVPAPLLVALVAACVSLPGLWLPFLSDDWAQVEAVGAGMTRQTPFGDFRPLFMASLWIDWRTWGASPAFFHASNLLLIAITAALVVVVARRYTGNAGLALGTGLVFAIHPFHVENAAWIAARGDPLFSVPYLLAILAYDRWRERCHRIPVAALLLYGAALLAKETAISLPFLLILIGRLDRDRRPGPGEWRRGYLPLLAFTAAHFLVLRPWVLGGAGRTLLEGFGPGWLLNGLGLTAAGVLPLDVELLSFRPVLWGTSAVATTLMLLLLARWRSGAVPGVALAAAPVFAVLIAPSLVGFQERYLFLPAAASALFLVALLRAARGAIGRVLAALLVIGWLAGTWAQWAGWFEAASASRALVAGLSRVADEPGVEEIVVANMPHHVYGGSVAGDFRAALAVNGRRPVRVRALTFVSYPNRDDDTLDGPRDVAITRTPEFSEVRMKIPRGPFWSYVGPRPPLRTESMTSAYGSVRFDAGGRVHARIPTAPERGRAACVWDRGGLVRLF